MLQRYYNLLCMAVGKDPVLFSSVIAFDGKPSELEFSWKKAQACRVDYEKAAEAFKRTILDKYVDQAALRTVKPIEWFSTSGGQPDGAE
jgi:hypothetical protein